MNDTHAFRRHIDMAYAEHPELFPQDMASGYVLHGFVTSRKQPITQRRITLRQSGETYQIRPSWMMPYMIGKTDDIEKALYLRNWGVPFEALAYVFGRNAMFWYRAYVSLGRQSIVGTTIKAPTQLPTDVVADEKHTRLKGETVYVTTTVAHECLLGANIADDAGTQALTAGYYDFQHEARTLVADYTPETVNTDGWEPTQKAWKALFPTITIILCFLHAFLKIKDRCKRSTALFPIILHKVWHTYHAHTPAQFSQRIRRLREWAQNHLTIAPLQEKVLELCQKAPSFKKAFQFPHAYRTRNALDRLMNYQDRLLYAMQYVHGTKATARLYVRAMALVWNFHPYGSKTQTKYGNRSSPFEGINGFRYHDNWLHTMMIAASRNGRRA
jgi:hypothetical protein